MARTSAQSRSAGVRAAAALAQQVAAPPEEREVAPYTLGASAFGPGGGSSGSGSSGGGGGSGGWGSPSGGGSSGGSSKLRDNLPYTLSSESAALGSPTDTAIRRADPRLIAKELSTAETADDILRAREHAGDPSAPAKRIEWAEADPEVREFGDFQANLGDLSNLLVLDLARQGLWYGVAKAGAALPDTDSLAGKVLQKGAGMLGWAAIHASTQDLNNHGEDAEHTIEQVGANLYRALAEGDLAKRAEDKRSPLSIAGWRAPYLEGQDLVDAAVSPDDAAKVAATLKMTDSPTAHAAWTMLSTPGGRVAMGLVPEMLLDPLNLLAGAGTTVRAGSKFVNMADSAWRVSEIVGKAETAAKALAKADHAGDAFLAPRLFAAAMTEARTPEQIAAVVGRLEGAADHFAVEASTLRRQASTLTGGAARRARSAANLAENQARVAESWARSMATGAVREADGTIRAAGRAIGREGAGTALDRFLTLKLPGQALGTRLLKPAEVLGATLGDAIKAKVPLPGIQFWDALQSSTIGKVADGAANVIGKSLGASAVAMDWIGRAVGGTRWQPIFQRLGDAEQAGLSAVAQASEVAVGKPGPIPGVRVLKTLVGTDWDTFRSLWSLFSSRLAALRDTNLQHAGQLLDRAKAVAAARRRLAIRNPGIHPAAWAKADYSALDVIEEAAEARSRGYGKALRPEIEAVAKEGDKLVREFSDRLSAMTPEETEALPPKLRDLVLSGQNGEADLVHAVRMALVKIAQNLGDEARTSKNVLDAMMGHLKQTSDLLTEGEKAAQGVDLFSRDAVTAAMKVWKQGQTAVTDVLRKAKSARTFLDGLAQRAAGGPTAVLRAGMDALLPDPAQRTITLQALGHAFGTATEDETLEVLFGLIQGRSQTAGTKGSFVDAIEALIADAEADAAVIDGWRKAARGVRADLEQLVPILATNEGWDLTMATMRLRARLVEALGAQQGEGAFQFIQQQGLANLHEWAFDGESPSFQQAIQAVLPDLEAVASYADGLAALKAGDMEAYARLTLERLRAESTVAAASLPPPTSVDEAVVKGTAAKVGQDSADLVSNLPRIGEADQAGAASLVDQAGGAKALAAEAWTQEQDVALRLLETIGQTDQEGFDLVQRFQPMMIPDDAAYLTPRSLASWERDLWDRWTQVTTAAGIDREGELTAALAVLRDAPEALTQIEGFEAIRQAYGAVYGRRFGDLDPRLAPVVETLGSWINAYEHLYAVRGEEFLADPLKRMAEWGVVEYVPHLSAAGDRLVNLDLHTLSSVPSLGRSVDSAVEAMQARLGVFLPGTKARALEGTIQEINAWMRGIAGKGLTETPAVFRVDPALLMARYSKAASSLATQDLVYSLFRSPGLTRVAETAEDLKRAVAEGWMPLFSTADPKRDLLLVRYGAHPPEVRPETIRDIAERYLKEGTPKNQQREGLGAWLAMIPLYRRRQVVEDVVARINAARILRDEPVIDLLNLPDAEELNREIDALYTTPGLDLASKPHPLTPSMVQEYAGNHTITLVPGPVYASMNDMLGAPVYRPSYPKQILDKLNSFFKLRATVINLPFHMANAMGNQMAALWEVGRAALNPSRQLEAVRLTWAAWFVQKYGSIQGAVEALRALPSQQVVEQGHELASLPGVAAYAGALADKARDMTLLGVFKTMGLEALAKESLDVGLGPMPLEAALAELERRGVLSGQYSNYHDLAHFEQMASEMAAAANKAGEREWQAMKEALSKIEDVALKAGSVLVAGPAGLFTTLSKETGAAVAQITENQARLLIHLDAVRRGQTIEEAGNAVQKTLFNYDDLTPFARRYLRTIIPFWTWGSKNIGLQLDLMREHPAAYARHVKFLVDDLPEALKAATPGDHEVYGSEQERMGRPSALRSRAILPIPGFPNLYLSGLKSPVEAFAETGGAYGTLLNPIAVIRDLTRRGDGSPKSSLRVLAQTHMVLRILAEQMFNQDFYFQKPLDQQRDPTPLVKILHGLETFRDRSAASGNMTVAATTETFRQALIEEWGIVTVFDRGPEGQMIPRVVSTGTIGTLPWTRAMSIAPWRQSILNAAAVADATIYDAAVNPEDPDQPVAVPPYISVPLTAMGLKLTQFDHEVERERKRKAYRDGLVQEGVDAGFLDRYTRTAPAR